MLYNITQWVMDIHGHTIQYNSFNLGTVMVPKSRCQLTAVQLL